MSRPNIIIITTDDQGYGDLSCMGNTDFITPNFDRIAETGARFECMYSNSPVCSPSRASLLTGRYPGYAGVRSILAGHRTATGLTHSEAPTIASVLKSQGYNTGAIGKWHLGLANESRPLENGFNYFYGFMAGCIDYYSHIFYWGMADGQTNPSHDLWENDTEINEDGKYFTELISDKSVEFVRHNSGKDPFFLYLAYNAPHYPMHAPKKYMDRFAHLPWDRQVMAAMIGAVDDGIGQIVDELKRKNIYENTLIYFQSDNGPSRESRNFMDGRNDPYYGGSSGKFRGHKFSLFEGGIRVPSLISWPASIPAGQVIAEPVAAMDIFPTLVNLAGGNAGDYNLNGKDIFDVVAKDGKSPHDMIFWEMEEQTAVRQGDYKLVLNGVEVEHENPKDAVFLANLADDPSEKINLVDTLPEKAQQLSKAAQDWRYVLERYWESTDR